MTLEEWLKSAKAVEEIPEGEAYYVNANGEIVLRITNIGKGEQK